jgi:hypothetical protein
MRTRTITIKVIKSMQIAPCGMNCSLCHAYIRDKNVCPGCHGRDDLKSKSCAMCHIKNCEIRKAGEFKYCFLCSEYPCLWMKRIDKRYRTKYAMSMIDNLEYIKQYGIRKFVRREKKKWVCAACGKLICVHKKTCIFCGYDWRLTRLFKEKNVRP